MSLHRNLLFLLFLLCQISYIITSDNSDWLHVNENNEIVDKDNKPVWLTGANWFGFNTGTGFFDGIWSGNFDQIMNGIADRGFNLLRIPISTQLLLQWKNGEPDTSKPNYNAWANPELKEGMTTFECFTVTLDYCKKLGIKVLLDVHSALTDASGHVYNLWYNSKISTDDWISSLEWVAEYYKDDDTILAIDLKNEPHGKGDDIAKGEGAKWDDSTDENNWKNAAETCALKVLEKNPNLLIMIEGIEVYPKENDDWTKPTHDYSLDYDYYFPGWWGGNLRGVKNHPIDLGKYQSQLIYSPHDYGPLVYNQPWFHDGFDTESIMQEYWYDSWFYILDQKISPLFMGEWGGFLDGGKNEKWLTLLRDLMIENRIHHTFWCINENSGDTGGLLTGGFAKWDEEKYELVKPSLWQTKDGKFIGLDHKVPLGKNGVSLSDVEDRF